MNIARGKLVLGEKCLDSQLSNIHNETVLAKLKGPSNLVLVPFQPSEQLSHIKVGCSGDCNIRKVSMTSARQLLKDGAFSNLEASSTHFQQNFVHCAFGKPCGCWLLCRMTTWFNVHQHLTVMLWGWLLSFCSHPCLTRTTC